VVPEIEPTKTAVEELATQSMMRDAGTSVPLAICGQTKLVF
jgi:hypothetical protein